MTPEQKDRLFTRLDEGQSKLLPMFAGSWKHVNTVASWRIYIVHDPCHDGDGHVDDDEREIWNAVKKDMASLDLENDR